MFLDPVQCTREVLLLWRVNNRNASWEPLAVALCRIGLCDTASYMKQVFTISQQQSMEVSTQEMITQLGGNSKTEPLSSVNGKLVM